MISEYSINFILYLIGEEINLLRIQILSFIQGNLQPLMINLLLQETNLNLPIILS